MDISIDYKESLAAIDQALNSMPKEIEGQEKEALRKVGQTAKKYVEQYIGESDIEQRAKNIKPSNYDGSRPYVHMRNDVIFSIRRDKEKNQYVSVRGGKLTGHKWHYVSDGHIARDGKTWVPGNGFLTKALQKTNDEVDAIIDEMLKKVVSGGR